MQWQTMANKHERKLTDFKAHYHFLFELVSGEYHACATTNVFIVSTAERLLLLLLQQQRYTINRTSARCVALFVWRLHCRASTIASILLVSQSIGQYLELLTSD